MFGDATFAERQEPDAALIAAEAEIRAMYPDYDQPGETDEEAEAFCHRFFGLDERIAEMAPETLVGAAIKLRRLLDPVNGRLSEDFAAVDESATTSLRQILAVIEREIAR